MRAIHCFNVDEFQKQKTKTAANNQQDAVKKHN